MRTRDGFLVSFVAAGLLAAGCGGGQTGDLGGANLGEASGGNCTEQEHALNDTSEQTELGFSVDALLELVEGELSASLAWGSSTAIDFSPSDSTTEVGIVIDCPDPNPRFVDAEPRNNGGGGELAASCPDQLRVDCELSISTDDGGLDEAYTVVVSASSQGVARVHQPLEAGGFSGTFEIGEPSADDTEVKQLALELSVSRFGVTGSLFSVLETRRDDAVGAMEVTYANWPAEGCENVGVDSFVVNEDSNAGHMAADAIVAVLAPEEERTLEWDGDEQATLELTVSAEGTGCVSYEPYDGGLLALYPARLSAKTDDGRLSFGGEGELRATFDDEEALGSATVEVSQVPTIDEVATLMSISASDAQDLAAAYDEFELSVSQRYESGTSLGTVRLLGITIPDCIKNPPQPEEFENGGGSPGCRGIDQTVLFEGNWTP